LNDEENVFLFPWTKISPLSGWLDDLCYW